MSLLDGTLHCPAVLELCAHRRIRRSNRLCCYAKEQKHETTHKGFSLRVPTIPKLKDIESARRVLESAFDSLSFDMPKIPIDSALQGLTFDIFKLSIPKRVLIFDITGFVATKLKKPPKDVEDVAILDEDHYPRCAWPRTMKEACVEEVFRIGMLGNLQDQESGVNLVPGESTAAYPHWMHRSPKADLSSEAEPPSVATSLSCEASFKAPVGPHCAWPRKTHKFVNANGALSARSITRDVRYPHSAWPRKSMSGNGGVVLDGQQSLVESNMGSAARKEEVSPCTIEGGPRCAWPRKAMCVKQSYHTEITTSLSEDLLDDGSQRGKDADDGEIASADYDGAAELPRRMVATSIGLSVVNQLVKGSIVTSLFDFCSLLPAGSLEIAEEEDAALDLGRRTLLVFIKHSAG